MTTLIDTKVYPAANGQAVIEQSNGASVTLSAADILVVIEQLHACYDYCASWKDETTARESENHE